MKTTRFNHPISSDANNDLRKIHGLLDAALVAMGEWADQHGTGECGCSYCTGSDGHAEMLNDDMRGISWTVGTGADLIASMIFGGVGDYAAAADELAAELAGEPEPARGFRFELSWGPLSIGMGRRGEAG
jgi:hypothetical protein